MWTANFHEVPVVDVTKDNILEIWPSLQYILQQSVFVALDVEMSGIGNRKTLMAKSIDDRYRGLCEVAKTRAILSLGLSCFCSNNCQNEESESETNKSLKFTVHTYNITVLCQNDYVVEPKSLIFLVEHGFDFNKQCLKGVHYYRNNNDKDEKKDSGKPCLKELFQQLIINEIPIVFHNALIDLVFLYQNFYTDLPSNLVQFTADLCEMFPGGIYDTKFVTEFNERTPASYLEYIFRKRQKDNLKQNSTGDDHILVNFPTYPASCGYVEMRGCSLDGGADSKHEIKLCESFSNHGWCASGKNCPNSHDVDAILRKEDLLLLNKKRKRNNRKRSRPVSDSTYTTENIADTSEECVAAARVDDNSDNQSVEEQADEENNSDVAMPPQVHNGKSDAVVQDSNIITKSRCEGHRAGFDAFMTGFTMATYIAKYGKMSPDVSDKTLKLSDFGLERMTNQIYLCGKDYALQIKKSDFCKSSKGHKAMIKMLKGEVT